LELLKRGRGFMSTEHTPVLVVVGGGAGLTASMLLAELGLEHPLVSARSDTSDLPKARVELAAALGQVLARPVEVGKQPARA
jgi:succinate dehydrogenase/fumarate reductase flavoprotein subunit